MSCSNHFCPECGAQVLTETFEVRNPDKPSEALIITQGRCIICEKVMSFAE